MTRGIAPFARVRLLHVGNDGPIKPRIAILHVDAGNASSLFDQFARRTDGIEAHFFVQKDGGLEQYRNIFLQADANFMANDFAVSIETQGFGEGEWNTAQLMTIKRLLLWLHSEAGIPLVKCPKWDGAGVGYHIQFGTPGKWTPVAKSCPGPDRIKQFNAVLVPWMKTALGPKEKPMNTVESWIAAVKQATKDHPIPADRQAANRMQDDVMERIKAGPKS